MHFKAILKSAFSAFTAVALLITTASVMSISKFKASAADSCLIDTSVEYQKIKGFGGMNLPEWIGDMTDSQRQTAFGNGDEQLGFSIVRIYVNDDPKQWYKAVPTAKAAIESGGIVFATPWNPPSSMCETFTRTYKTWDGKTATQENQKRLRYDKYEAYATHLNDFVHFMKDNGVDLYAISIQNEPDYGEDWTWMTSTECVDFLANYADKIDCPVMSPESFSYNKEYYNAILNNSKAYDNTAIFGTHFYGTSRNNMDFPILENDKKEIFMTEVYVPNSSSDADTWPEAIDVSENIHNGLVVGNMNAYVWWYIRRSYGPMKENGAISKRGYCMAQYSKYVRPGDVRVKATESPASNVYISAYTNEDNRVTIVAVNKNTEGYAQNFSINGNETISSVTRYRTSATENLAKTANIESNENSFWAQLPAQSVSTFVVTTSVKSNIDGYYFHDTFEDTNFDWTSRGSATIELSGRTPYMGKNALLVSGRTAAWNGTQKTLNSKVFNADGTYSFSAVVKFLDGKCTGKFSLTLQYTDEGGTTKYANIDTKTAVRGEYVQLYNRNYTIPAGATNITLIVETTDDNMNFYVDEAIGAVADTIINGTAEIDFILGDINQDKVINCFDLISARRGVLGDFETNIASVAADVNQDGLVDADDLQLLEDYLLCKIQY